MTEVVTTETICIQDELPITLITSMDLETFIKGHHIYKNIWTPQLDELLEVSTEPDNPVDKFAVAVKKNQNIVGHLKKGKTGRFAKTLLFFCVVTHTRSVMQRSLGKDIILAMGMVYKFHAYYIYLDKPSLCLFYKKN